MSQIADDMEKGIPCGGRVFAEKCVAELICMCCADKLALIAEIRKLTHSHIGPQPGSAAHEMITNLLWALKKGQPPINGMTFAMELTKVSGVIRNLEADIVNKDARIAELVSVVNKQNLRLGGGL